MNFSPFAGSTVLITGASSGIGAAFAEALAPSGATLVLTARNPARLAAAAATARAAGALVDTVEADLAPPGGVAGLVHELAARGHVVDHLINNAGIGLVGRGHEAPLAGQLRVVDIDVRVPTELALRLLPQMVARGRGGLLNVASIAAFQGLPWLSTYAGSKAYLLAWSESLHHELRGTGVRCTALCPGPVATGWFAEAHLERPPGWPFLQSPAAAVRAGLRGYLAGRSHVFSGPFAAASAWLTRAVPRAVATAVATGFARPRRGR